jgi:hypothetical protein
MKEYEGKEIITAINEKRRELKNVVLIGTINRLILSAEKINDKELNKEILQAINELKVRNKKWIEESLPEIIYDVELKEESKNDRSMAPMPDRRPEEFIPEKMDRWKMQRIPSAPIPDRRPEEFKINSNKLKPTILNETNKEQLEIGPSKSMLALPEHTNNRLAAPIPERRSKQENVISEKDKVKLNKLRASIQQKFSQAYSGFIDKVGELIKVQEKVWQENKNIYNKNPSDKEKKMAEQRNIRVIKVIGNLKKILTYMDNFESNNQQILNQIKVLIDERVDRIWELTQRYYELRVYFHLNNALVSYKENIHSILTDVKKHESEFNTLSDLVKNNAVKKEVQKTVSLVKETLIEIGF